MQAKAHLDFIVRYSLLEGLILSVLNELSRFFDHGKDLQERYHRHIGKLMNRICVLKKDVILIPLNILVIKFPH